MEISNIINKYVILLQKKINTDEFIFLKKYHPDEYKQKLIEYVPKFEESYPFLFNKIINNEDLEFLPIFLKNIDDINSGKQNLNDVRNDLGYLLHNKYINNIC